MARIVGVRKRGDSYLWDVTYNGIRRTGTESTLEEAMSARVDALTKMKHGNVDATEWTLKKAVDAAYAAKWEGKPSAETAVKNIGYALKYFGDTDLDKIDEDAIDQYRQWLKDDCGNSNSTINRKTSALSVVLRHAYSRRKITRMPYIGRLHEDNTHERYVTTDEEDKIISLLYEWGKTEHAIAVIVLIDTGMRSGELFSLKRDDVNFDLSKNGVINIWKQNTKTAKSRTIPLTERASKALRIVFNEKKSPTDRLFPHDRFWLINVWDKVKLALGLEDCPVYHPHILRHTFGSRLAQAGVPLQKIAYLMGHTSIRTTMRYAHLCPTAYEGIIDVLDDLEKTRRLDSQALNV